LHKQSIKLGFGRAQMKIPCSGCNQHLDAGANVNASGKTLLGYSVTPLHEAASWGQKGNIELLIANGANVNAKDETGKTPLDSATSELADLLRKHGGKTGEELKVEGK